MVPRLLDLPARRLPAVRESPMIRMAPRLESFYDQAPRGDAGSGRDVAMHGLRERAAAAAVSFRAASRSRIYRATAALLVVFVALGALALSQYWTAIYKDAQVRGATLSFLLAEQTTRTFQAVDLTLAGLGAVYEAAPVPERDTAFERLMGQRGKELDFIQTLYVMDRSGRVVQSSGAPGTAVTGEGAAPYLVDFERDPALAFLIGQPLFSRPGKLSAIPVMRRLTDREGRFAGLIVATVEPRYFSDFYRAVDIGRRGGSIDLYQDNGTILLASTSDDPMADAALARAPTFDLKSSVGNFTSPASENTRRLVVFHRAAGYPLLVAVGVDLSDLRGRWWRVAVPTLVAMGVIVVLAASLATLVIRRLHERREADRRAVMMQKLEALGQMTASVSHDFRNLLTVMTSTLRLLRKRGPDEKVLRAAEEAIERGNGLITQLLAFSKRNALEVRRCDINALIGSLDDVLRHAAGPDVLLRFDRGEDLPVCDIDQTQFDAALMNLVVNARQAMPEGGTVTISTRAAAKGGVVLEVADTGAGIAPQHLRRVFEPFFTTKADTGTGLGLAQVYAFMRRIGGDATVTSEPGAGTTFTLSFPAATEGAAALPAEVERPAA